MNFFVLMTTTKMSIIFPVTMFLGQYPIYDYHDGIVCGEDHLSWCF